MHAPDLSEWLLAEHTSSNPCLVLPDGTLRDRGAVRAAVERRAATLAPHVHDPGCIVGIRGEAPAQVLTDVLAVLMTGAVPAPVAPAQDVESEWSTLGACAVLGASGMPNAIRLLKGHRRLHETSALIVTTSGTTATPRRVLHSAEALQANVRAIQRTLRFDSETRHGLLLDPWYAYGLVGQWFACLRGGASLALVPPSPYASVRLNHIRAMQIDSVSAVPSLIRTLCGSHGPKPVLRCLASAGAHLDERTREAMDSAFPEAELWNQYGCTEAGPRIAAISSKEQAFWRGAAGIAIPSVHVHCEGSRDAPEEIWVDSPSIMQGYLDEPVASHQALTPDGLRTGDLGWMEQDVLFVAGRSDDRVKISGVRVYLSAVRAMLCAHPGVHDAAVVAVPSERSGTALVALVVTDDLEHLRGWIRDHLQVHMRPRRLINVSKLPLTERGKVDRVALQQLVESTR